MEETVTLVPHVAIFVCGGLEKFRQFKTAEERETYILGFKEGSEAWGGDELAIYRLPEQHDEMSAEQKKQIVNSFEGNHFT